MITTYNIRFGLGIALIPLSIILLQAHGIPFWYTIVRFHTNVWWMDWAPAALWSLTLEVISIWGWLSNEPWKLKGIKIEPKKAFATVVTLLLISGPLIQTLAPLFERSVLEVADDTEVGDALVEVEYYRQLASTRSGWQDDLRLAENELRLVRKRVKTTVIISASTQLKAIMTAISLIVFTMATVLALNSFSAVSPVSDSRKWVASRLKALLKRGHTISNLSDKLQIGEGVLQNALDQLPVHDNHIKAIQQRLGRGA